jgi:hypothetical protein
MANGRADNIKARNPAPGEKRNETTWNLYSFFKLDTDPVKGLLQPSLGSPGRRLVVGPLPESLNP